MDNPISTPKPPKLAVWLLKRFFQDDTGFYTQLGDIDEAFNAIAKEKNNFAAKAWYWMATLRSIPYSLRRSLSWSVIMIKNYLKIALRNVKRHKVFSVINIAGLTIGMTCVVLLLLWIQDEVGTDKFHEKIDDIYLVSAHFKKEKQELQMPSVPGVGPLLKELFPEVEESARFLAGYRSFVFTYKDQMFSERRVFPADSEALEKYTFPLIEGDPKTALEDPYSLVLSERVAKKYFGNENPLDKVITVDSQFQMTVKGIMKEVPANSTFRFDILMPLEFYARNIHKQVDLSGFSNQNFFVFVQLQNGSSYADLNSKIREFVVNNYGNDDYVPVLRPFGKFHLYRLGDGGGHIEQIRLIGFLTIFILLVACINFMNLTTSRSGTRSREIGMRKVIGAFRKDIVKQFYFETSLFVLIAMVLTVFLARLFLPLFNALFQKELSLEVLQNPALLGFLIGTALITALVAGSYPALVMSSFRPLRIIKGSMGSSFKRSGFRKTLVVIQFSLAIGLIAYAAGIYKQLSYLQTMDLGYNMENLVFFSSRGELQKRYETAKHEFQQIPGVTKVSACSTFPTGGRSNSKSWQWEGKAPELEPLITDMSVDSDFLETFEIPLLEGRFFRKENDPSGNSGEILINEKLAGIMGKKNPVGMRMSFEGRDYMVIGIFKDYLPNPSWRVEEPLILFQDPEQYRFLFLKIDPENVPHTLAQVKDIFERLNPGFPFEYDFLDATYEAQFNSVRRTRSLIAYLAGFAMFISCLGLFGLVSFTAEQRTKEIGIRKVLGSSVPRIVMLLSKDLTRLVLLANLLAWPAAWYLLNRWLQDFLYRTHVHFDIFIIAGTITFLIALITMSYQAIKAATADPVDSLRYE